MPSDNTVITVLPSHTFAPRHAMPTPPHAAALDYSHGLLAVLVVMLGVGLALVSVVCWSRLRPPTYVITYCDPRFNQCE